MTALNDFIIEPPTPLQASLLEGFVGFDDKPSLLKTDSPEVLTTNTKTIFFDIVKASLIEEITKIRDKLESDRIMLSFINEHLSQKRILLVDRLLSNIWHFDGGEFDEQTYEQLNYLVSQAINSDRRAFLKHGDNGIFVCKMGKAKVLLDTLYSKLNAAGLLNLPHDEEPLSCFYVYAVKFFAQCIISDELTKPTESLVFKTLKSCTEYLKSLNTTCQETKKNIVLEFIEKLKKENQFLLKTLTCPVPVMVGFFSVKFSVKSPVETMCLEQCMNKAIDAIKELRSENFASCSL